MKKVLFFAAAAAAALTACSKSEVIDSKYGNDQIGFQTYLGRDAQTKASVTTIKNLEKVFVYGYYTGNTTWTETTTANLWTNGLTLAVAEDGKVTQPAGDDIRYWANAEDNYTFLAYAPINAVKLPVVVAEGNANPTLNYTVDNALANQIDVLYAEPVNGTTTKLGGTVALTMKHALARLTVKASATGENFKFDVKKVSLTGSFYTNGKLPLATGEWKEQVATENTEYVFHTKEDEEGNYDVYNAANALKATPVDYAETDNYLMIIPKAEGEATLTVDYTTYYQNQESKVMKQTFPITINFEKGKAYSLNLTFSHEDKPIQFSVTVEDWGTETNVDKNVKA